MHKIKPGTLTAGMAKNNLKGTTEKFVASGNAFSFMSSVKGKPAYWKKFLETIYKVNTLLGGGMGSKQKRTSIVFLRSFYCLKA